MRGYKSKSDTEKKGLPSFGLDIGVSMTKGSFFASKRGEDEGTVYEGKVIDLLILETISTSEEQERKLRSSAESVRKTMRVAALARWPVKTGDKVVMSEWAPATITLRGSAQGILICACRTLRKECDGNDAGIAFRVSTSGAEVKKIGQGSNQATIIDTDTCKYTVLPSDPEISEDVARDASEWWREIKALRDGGGSNHARDEGPPPIDDGDIPF